METFRPWGDLSWLISRLPNRTWSIIGCCGTEARSVSVAEQFKRESFDLASFVEIVDPEPLDHHQVEGRLTIRRGQLESVGFNTSEIVRHNLLADLDTIDAIVASLANAGATSLLIDITSLPKYWFFPLIKSALAEPRLTDVVACYTAGVDYAENLSENLSAIRPLPGFAGVPNRTRHDSLIIGIGFEPTGLDALLSDQASDSIKLIFPFPPGPPGHHKNWMFVKYIEDLTNTHSISAPDRVHIHMNDCSQVFDALSTMTDRALKSSALAPYGPKTVSLAMCMYALAATRAGHDPVPVLYAQPRRYAIDYTASAAIRGGVPATVGYSLRLAGRDLYTLS